MRVKCECVDSNGNPWPDCTCDHGWREIQTDPTGPHLDKGQSVEEFCQAYQRCNW